MEIIKKLIFSYIDKNNIKDNNLITLLFGTFKIYSYNSYVYLLYNKYKYNIDILKDVVEDILQETVTIFYEELYSLEDINLYNKVQQYIYNTYIKSINRDMALEYYKRTTTKNTKIYDIKLTKTQQKVWDSVVDRLNKYQSKHKNKGLFKDKKQKQQILNKLVEAQIIKR